MRAKLPNITQLSVLDLNIFKIWIPPRCTNRRMWLHLTGFPFSKKKPLFATIIPFSLPKYALIETFSHPV